MKLFLKTLILLLISHLIIINETYSQVLEPHIWNYSKMTALGIVAQKNDEVINLNDLKTIFSKYKISDYKSCKVPIEEIRNDKKNDFLNFITLITATDSVLIICDKNRNGEYADDIIYITKARVEDKNDIDISGDFVNVTIDSLPILDSTGKTTYVKSDFFLKPNVTLQNKKITLRQNPLIFFVKNYNSLAFYIGNEIYEMAIFSHPVTQSFYNHTNLYWNENKLIYAVFKKEENGRDSTITTFQSPNDLELDSSKHPLVIGTKTIKISYHNKEFTNVKIDISEYVEQEEQFDLVRKINTFNCLNLKKETPFLDSSKIKLLAFGGSWCAPCKKALPELKKIHNTFKDKLIVLEILIERSIADASAYTIKNKLPWKTYFESLTEKSSNPVQTHFKVFEYPTFYLLDKNNKVILKTSSDEGIKEIAAKIKDLKL